MAGFAHESGWRDEAVSKKGRFAHERAAESELVSGKAGFAHESCRRDEAVSKRGLFAHERAAESELVSEEDGFAHEVGLTRPLRKI